MRTSVTVEVVDGRHRVRLRSGVVRAQLIDSGTHGCRVALLASTALLLGGDRVEVVVEVGPGACLELFDVAATVAYHGRGQSAAWTLSVAVGPDARLDYAAEPLIVADGADVARSTTIDVASSGSLRLRETLVLGRAGESGGDVSSTTRLAHSGRSVWREDQRLTIANGRSQPGLLGAHRVVDSVLTVGTTPAEGGTRFLLPYGAGALGRYLGADLAGSPWSP